LLEEAPTVDDAQVTRSTGFSIDVLEEARDAALDETPVVAQGPVTTDFFANAQANLANDLRCIDDLRALAAQTRVYFPSGGLTGDAAGIDQARVLGVLAEQCPGVTIRVQGHSDPSGNPAINQRLSLERAEAIVTRIAASGIDPQLFVAEGLGSSVPSGLTGTQPSSFYDRRVEFAIIVATDRAAFIQASAPAPVDFTTTACVAQLRAAVEVANIEYAPRGMTTSDADEALAVRLGTLAANCPEARLRIVGQHTDDPRAGEDGSTGRLRAVVLMGKLVNAGIPSEQVIIGAPSHPQPVAGLSDSRIDFQVILEEL
ncbi:MAG: OmpA family protein, partial [Pseudomonadota bacterium]